MAGHDEPGDRRVRDDDVDDRLGNGKRDGDGGDDGQDRDWSRTTVNDLPPGLASAGSTSSRFFQRSFIDPAHDRINEAMIAIVSAIRLPGCISSPTDCRWMYDRSWIRIRKGWSVPSLTTYVAYWPRGLSTAA